MGAHGFEPGTSSLSGTRSNQTELCAQRLFLLNRHYFYLTVFFLVFDTLKEQKYSISKWSRDKGWSGKFLFFSKEPFRNLLSGQDLQHDPWPVSADILTAWILIGGCLRFGIDGHNIFKRQWEPMICPTDLFCRSGGFRNTFFFPVGKLFENFMIL